MEKEYQDLWKMTMDAYEYVKTTQGTVKLNRKLILDLGGNKFTITLSNGDILFFYPYRHPISNSFSKLSNQLNINHISLEDLINKQLLPFL